MRQPHLCIDCGEFTFSDRCGRCGAKNRHKINRFRFASESLARIGKILADARTYINGSKDNLTEFDGYIISAHSLSADLDKLEKEYAQLVNDGMVESINQHLKKVTRAAS